MPGWLRFAPKDGQAGDPDRTENALAAAFGWREASEGSWNGILLLRQLTPFLRVSTGHSFLNQRSQLRLTRPTGSMHERSLLVRVASA
jgi:hypothetical protein